MLRRPSPSIVLLVAIISLASHNAAFIVDPLLRTTGAMHSALRPLYQTRTDEYLQTKSHDLTRIPSARQDELEQSDQKQQESDASESGSSTDTANDAAVGEDNIQAGSDHDPSVSEASAGTANQSAAADDEATSPDGESTSADGESTSVDSESTSDDGESTSAHDKPASSDGVATSADGGASTGESGPTSSDPNSEAPPQNATDEDNTGSTSEQVPEQKKSATSAGDPPSTNATDPFQHFILMQMVEIPSDGGFEQITLFQNASFVGPFAGAPNTSNIEELTDPNDEKWYTDSEYADRIAFQFTYTPESKDYVISEPAVGAGSTSGILPVVKDFRNDPSTGGGSFTVLYRCQHGAPQTYHVTLNLQVTAERSIETIWTKKCGSGRHEHLEFGFRAHDRSVELFNQDGTYGTDEQRTLEVGPLETSTELVIELVAPAQNQQFLDPYVSSDSESVSVQLRGTISNGTLSVDDPTPFAVLYECKSATTATISFTVEIPPWDNVTAQWRKDCGGSLSEALLIGTTGKDSYDVMQDGELASQYNVTDKTRLDDADGVVELIPPEVDTKRFDITNSDDTSDIHIQTITTTMSNPEVVTAVVNTPMLGIRSYIPSTGDVLERHETKSLSLHFLCKREGKSLVLVTLPTLRYKNVEFGFIKQCNEPRAYHHSGFLQTAGSLMATFLFLTVVGAIATCIYLKRRQGTKYIAVSTNDPAIP